MNSTKEFIRIPKRPFRNENPFGVDLSIPLINYYTISALLETETNCNSLMGKLIVKDSPFFHPNWQSVLRI